MAESSAHNTPPITVHVNGEPRTLPAGTNVREMMEHLDFTQTGSAVAINLTFIPTDRYEETPIHPNDTIDILGAIYGG